MTGSGVRRRRQQKRDALATSLPFPLPSRYQINVYPSRSSPTSSRLPAHSNLGIPNPDYSGDNTPRYAAFRLSNMLSGLERSHLRFRVQNMWKTRLQSHTVKSRGNGFHQWWFGVWTRYATHAMISRDTRQPKSASMVKLLLSSYDRILGSKTRSHLKGLDPSIAKAMAINHRAVARHLRLQGNELRASVAGKRKYKSWYRESFERTKGFMRGRDNKAYRMGGMGTMMAVSWGEGTDWHKDCKDQKNHYTMVFCLGQPAILHLPELGYDIPLKPGNVVGLLAYKYTHKLAPEEKEGQKKLAAENTMHEPLRQIVFTSWSDQRTRMAMLSSGEFVPM